MIKPVVGAGIGMLLTASAVGVHAEKLSNASVERYIANHQRGCVAALSEKVNNAGYTLPFGFVDNYCLCLGEAMFSGMTQAQAQELVGTNSDSLPESMAVRQTKIRKECVASTTSMYLADLGDRSN